MSQIVLKHLSVDKVVAIAELAQRSGEEPATSESLDVLPSAEEVQLEDMIKELNENELRELTALMWLGRGFGGETVESWGQLVENAKGPESLPGYLSGKPLGRYLPSGLSKLGIVVQLGSPASQST